MKIVIALALLALLMLLSAVGKAIRRKTMGELPAAEGRQAPAPAPPAEEESDKCCGQHAVCEKQERMRLRTRRELYFNDEELDRYQGTAPDGYTDEQIEEFREVLYTMRPQEVAEWTRCLDQRRIELPDALRSEVVMLINGD